MTRDSILALFLLFALAVPVQAENGVASTVIARVEAEGYTVSEVKRTLLGRTLILSQNSNHIREVVLNRHTGEILRDRLYARAQAKPSPKGAPAPAALGAPGNAGSDGNGSGGNGGGAGNGGGNGKN